MNGNTDRSKAIADLLGGFVAIPSGRVLIGSTEALIAQVLDSPDLSAVEPEWLRKELPRRTVVVPSFLIGRTPVTVSQVEALIPWTGVRPIAPTGADHPASLSVGDAFLFCAAVSDLAGRTVMPPSEVEWVRAARGDDDRVYPWGDEWSTQRANLVTTGIGKMVAVGSFPSGASPFGVLDLVGNADELTRTLYRPFPGAPADVPPLEPWAHSPFVTKGGGFFHARDLARIDRRHGIYGDNEPLALRLSLG